MPIPGNAEPMAYSGQQQVQQHRSINFSHAIPIKKRRFPIIRPPSPSPEEKPSGSEGQDSSKKQESNIPDESSEGKAISPDNSDVSKIPALIVKKEVVPTNTESRQATPGILASNPHEEKASGSSLGPQGELKMDILRNVNSSMPEVPKRSIAATKTIVKQEIISGQTEDNHTREASKDSMNVELSLGPKEPVSPALSLQNSEAICRKSDKSDPSLLSLALREEKLVRHDKSDSSKNNVCNQVSANRSNWDLNTTMDVWEGSNNSDPFAHRLVDIGGFKKSDSCHNEKSSLTTIGSIGGSFNKGKHVLDGKKSDSSNIYRQSIQQGKVDDSLGLRLAMPYRELNSSGERSPLPVKVASTSVCSNSNLQQVQLPALNVNRTVKPEPVDENSKHDCSIGSSSSSNVGSLKFGSVKKEIVNTHSLGTVLQSSTSISEKLIDRRSIKSEKVLEGIKEAGKYGDAIRAQPVAKVMQHQDSCVSSSVLPMSLLPHNPSMASTCSELITSGGLSNQSGHSVHGKELYDPSDVPDGQIRSMVSGGVVSGKSKLARVDEDTTEFCQSSELATNDDEKMNISVEMEDAFGSDCETQENCGVDSSMNIVKNVCGKEDEEYEDGEVREPLQHSAGEDPKVEGKKKENLNLAESDSQDLQNTALLGDHNSTPDFVGEDAVKENHDDTNKNCAGTSYEPMTDGNSMQKLSEKVLEGCVDNKSSISVTPSKELNPEDTKDVRENPSKEVSTYGPADGGHGVEHGDEAADKVVKEICSGESDLTSNKVDASINGPDAAKDSNNISNKSRIINLSRASAVTSPCKTRSIPSRLLTSRSGKERYSDPDGEMQPRGNRDELYTGGSNKFAKDKVNDHPVRNSRPTFMLGKGRISGRFGSFRGEWDSDHNFASDNPYGPSDYRVIRRKHSSSIPDAELEFNGYGIPQDGTSLGSNRRKIVNEEFPNLRRTTLRRLSPGDRDGPVARGNQMFRRIPRDMSPNRCNVDDDSDLIGLRHHDKFMRHLSHDMMDPIYNRPQAIYGELDGQQLMRGNRNNFRKGYDPRIRSKSPVRSRTRSPGPWSSPRRRSPNGLQELSQHRSTTMYRTGRVRSPDHAFFRDEMVSRRRGSPSYVPRHPNDLRDAESGREHVHPRPGNLNRRGGSPGRVFPRSGRRENALDPREMGDGVEFINGPLHSSKFIGEGNMDERRKFVERGGGPPLRSFRPDYGNEGENFRFHMNDGPRPYRFCPDADAEFVERSNMREREFDGRIKHQPFGSRRIRNIEEQQEGNYRPVERVWHEEGFNDARVKRKRF